MTELMFCHYVSCVQHTDEYRSLNPSRQVPTLLIDGTTLTQSVSCLHSLHKSCSL